VNRASSDRLSLLSAFHDGLLCELLDKIGKEEVGGDVKEAVRYAVENRVRELEESGMRGELVRGAVPGPDGSVSTSSAM